MLSPPDFQVRASGELVQKSTRKGVVRGTASGRDGEAFSMPAGEGSEADRWEGRSKRQKEKEREEGRGLGAGLGSDRPGWPGNAPATILQPECGSNCGEGRQNRNAPGSGFLTPAQLHTLLAALSTGNHVIPVRRHWNRLHSSSRPKMDSSEVCSRRPLAPGPWEDCQNEQISGLQIER